MSRAVITGIGVLAPNGAGREEFWAATLGARTGISALTSFDAAGYPVHLAGQVSGFNPAEHIPGRLVPQTDRMTQLALTAADWAIKDAAVDLSALDDFDSGVVTAASSGGFEFGQRELQNLWAHGPQHVSAYQSFAWFYAVNTGQISIRHGLRGPTGVTVSDQAGGLDAVAHARRHLRRGRRLMVTGAVDATLCPWGLVAQLPSGRLSRGTDPARAYLPFDAAADGHVVGEGGAILVLEDAEAAAARGAPHVYAEVAGYRATFDPAPRSGRPPRLAAAITGALEDASLTAGDVDVVFADGAAVPELDRVEADAIAATFGPCGVPVTAPKSMTGRLLSGGAPLDLAAAALAIRDGVIPPTANVTRVRPEYRIDLVTAPRSAALRTALVLARGHGGFNSAMVLRAPTLPAVPAGPTKG